MRTRTSRPRLPARTKSTTPTAPPEEPASTTGMPFTAVLTTRWV